MDEIKTLEDVLRELVQVRLEVGDRWLTYSFGDQWVVWERQYRQTRTRMVCETDNIDAAIAALVEG